MRWHQVGVIALSVMAMTGCPSEFGKDGRVAKAVHDDSKENLLEIKNCTPKRRQEVCGNGRENSEACRECGGP